MLGLLGKKVGMTRLYNEIGEQVVTTGIEIESCSIIQKKTTETDGYNALQLGYEDKKERKVSKALKGHFSKAKVNCKRYIKEFRCANVDDYEVGQELNIKDVFELGQFVDITGSSKGKGFAGTMKRHNFSRGPMTHGSRNHRKPGSIGQCATPNKVFKGKRMPGRMGNDTKTIQNLKIVKVDLANNMIFLTGAVPGPKGNLVQIKKAVKK